MSTIQPIGDADKIRQILDSLHTYIVGGKLAAGTELPSERELAETLQVSRFSLREALRVAQAQGLIEISRGRRPRVAEPSTHAAAGMIALTLRRSSHTLLDLADARLVLETHIARIAARKASKEQIAELQGTIDRIRAHPSEPELCVDEDLKFHALLVKAAGNFVFEIMLAPLAELLRESRTETLRRGVDPVLDGHVAVLEAIRQRDADAAEAAMIGHLKLARKHLRERNARKAK